MKKLITLAICCLVALGAAAQVRIGLKAGGQYTYTWDTEFERLKMPGYVFGLTAEYKINDSKWSLAPELLFSSSYHTNHENYLILPEELNLEASDFHNSTCNNYLQLPVLMRYNVSPKVGLDIGPQVNLMVYDKSTMEYTLNGTKHTHKGKFDSENRSFTFGLAAGVTYKPTDHIFVQARYALDLTHTYDFGSTKLGSAHVSVGYNF